MFRVELVELVAEAPLLMVKDPLVGAVVSTVTGALALVETLPAASLAQA